jgi:hypothetical protein
MYLDLIAMGLINLAKDIDIDPLASRGAEAWPVLTIDMQGLCPAVKRAVQRTNQQTANA